MISQTHDRNFEVFYDSGCPICRREIDWLRKFALSERVFFTDINQSSFDPSPLGKTKDQLMAQIHGRLPNGELVVGVETLRQLYSALGFRKLVAISRWPLISQVASLSYWAFAKLRPWLPRSGCADGDCRING